MKLAHVTLLSVGTMMVLSGCYERGKAIPPSENKHLKKQKQEEEKLYDFPVLKLSANVDKNSPVEDIVIPKATTKTVPTPDQASSNPSRALRFPKKSKETIKENTNTKTPVVKIDSNILQETSNTEKPKETETKITPKIENKIQMPASDNAVIETKKDAIRRAIAETKKLQLKNAPKAVHTSKPKVKKALKKKVQHKRKPHKSTSSSQIPIISSIVSPDVSLQDIPILNKILPKPSEASKYRIKKRHPHTTRPQVKNNKNASIPVLDNRASSTSSVGTTNFSGGTSSSGLDMAKIRVETDNYQTNIVLDSYKWVGYNSIPTEASAVSGTYFFKYEPFNNRIVATIKGYNTFSALLTKQDELLKNNPMIKSIYIDRYIGDDGIKFIIELKKKVKVNVIDVEDPGSIIVELYPLKEK